MTESSARLRRARGPTAVPDVFHEITESDDEILDSFWLPLYRRAFPAEERVPEEDIRQSTESRDEHLLVGYAGGRAISISRYDMGTDDRGSHFAYLMYMAVDEQAVSRGHGQQMFREVVRRARADTTGPKVLVFEVQRPAPGHAHTARFQDAGRRIAFYRRLGAHVLSGVDYVQHVPGHQGVQMHLMYLLLRRPGRAEDALAAAEVLFGDDVRQRAGGRRQPAVISQC